MELLIFVRWVHVIGACVLLGTGAGIAFFMLMAVHSRSPAVIPHTASVVVLADLLFTATAVIVQPLSGIWLAQLTGWSLAEGWIIASILLYLFVGVFWLPVVWIQIRLRDLAIEAVNEGVGLPAAFDRLYTIWLMCGVSAFIAVLAILWLMLARPDLHINFG